MLLRRRAWNQLPAARGARFATTVIKCPAYIKRGQLVTWSKSAGQTVSAGDTLCIIQGGDNKIEEIKSGASVRYVFARALVKTDSVVDADDPLCLVVDDQSEVGGDAVTNWPSSYYTPRRDKQPSSFELMKHVIVSNFRGCGKTTTLDRLKARHWFLKFRYPHRKVEFFNFAQVSAMGIAVQRAKLFNDNRGWLSIIMQVFVAFALACVVAVFYRVLSVLEKDYDERRWTPEWVCANAIPIVKDELPSTTHSVCVLVLIAAAVTSFRLRRRVLIFDEVSGVGQEVNAFLGLVERLRRMEFDTNVIFVTSNEGLDSLMKDPSLSTRTMLPMPPLTSAEMNAKLGRMGLELPALISLDSLAQMYGKELSHSARFHIVANELGMDFNNPSRAALMAMCNNLMLAADHPAAIAGSHCVRMSALKAFPLGGCVTKEGGGSAASRTALDYVEAAFPNLNSDAIPHRLVVPLILLATTHVSNVPQDEGKIYSYLQDRLNLEGFENTDTPLFDPIREITAFIKNICEEKEMKAELEYFLLLLGDERKVVFKGILSKYDSNEDRHPSLFRTLRLKIFDAFLKKFDRDGKMKIEEAIANFEAVLPDLHRC